MFETIKYEVKNGIAYVTVNRPEALNALNIQVLDELYKAFEAFEENHDADVAILTGEGRAFVAGADIIAMSTMSTMEGRNIGIKGHKLMNYMESIEKPIIAAINGFALGGGNELAMACDIRIASEKAKFAQPEAGLGITPGFGGTQRLPRLVGTGVAKEMIYTGRIVKADEALRIGLINKVVSPELLMEEAKKLADMISINAPIAVKLCKDAINRGTQVDIDSAIVIEANDFGKCFDTEDQKEGMSAFIERREKNFKNK